MSSLLDPQPPIDPMTEFLQWGKDSTLAVSGMNLFAGYFMGYAFSLFGSMISAETATQCMGTADFFRYSMRGAHRMGANFAFFGFLFGGIEVALEKRLGRKDVWNPTIAGGIIGGAYGWRSYKHPGLVGGFVLGGAFSILFERIMDSMGFAQH